MSVFDLLDFTPGLLEGVELSEEAEVHELTTKIMDNILRNTLASARTKELIEELERLTASLRDNVEAPKEPSPFQRKVEP
jgi:hypothetical protein